MLRKQAIGLPEGSEQSLRSPIAEKGLEPVWEGLEKFECEVSNPSNG
jgi:hypothetical protein